MREVLDRPLTPTRVGPLLPAVMVMKESTPVRQNRCTTREPRWGRSPARGMLHRGHGSTPEALSCTSTTPWHAAAAAYTSGLRTDNKGASTTRHHGTPYLLTEIYILHFTSANRLAATRLVSCHSIGSTQSVKHSATTSRRTSLLTLPNLAEKRFHCLFVLPTFNTSRALELSLPLPRPNSACCSR